LRSLDKLHQLTGLTLTVIKAAPGVWCDYCKVRFGTNSPLGQKGASYTVISNHPKSQGVRRHSATRVLSRCKRGQTVQSGHYRNKPSI
jgi:hypothetical protein